MIRYSAAASAAACIFLSSCSQAAVNRETYVSLPSEDETGLYSAGYETDAGASAVRTGASVADETEKSLFDIISEALSAAETASETTSETASETDIGTTSEIAETAAEETAVTSDDFPETETTSDDKPVSTAKGKLSADTEASTETAAETAEAADDASLPKEISIVVDSDSSTETKKIPQLDIESGFADTVNKEIADFIGGTGRDADSISYASEQDGPILSILISAVSGQNITYRSINADLDTEKILTDEEFLSLYGISRLSTALLASRLAVMSAAERMPSSAFGEGLSKEGCLDLTLDKLKSDIAGGKAAFRLMDGKAAVTLLIARNDGEYSLADGSEQMAQPVSLALDISPDSYMTGNMIPVSIAGRWSDFSGEAETAVTLEENGAAKLMIGDSETDGFAAADDSTLILSFGDKISVCQYAVSGNSLSLFWIDGERLFDMSGSPVKLTSSAHTVNAAMKTASGGSEYTLTLTEKGEAALSSAPLDAADDSGTSVKSGWYSVSGVDESGGMTLKLHFDFSDGSASEESIVYIILTDSYADIRLLSGTPLTGGYDQNSGETVRFYMTEDN